MKTATLDFKTVHECNCRLGCRTLHPQAAIIDLENRSSIRETVRFEFYAVLLTEGDDGCCCGREYYDYSKAAMIFLRPGEIFRMNETRSLPQMGRLLAFHPDLLLRTTLCNHMDDYTFFRYGKEEALHLSVREKGKVSECLNAIADELAYGIDGHSRTLISRYIELLLDYCRRFYERQFITREDRNKALVGRLDEIIDDYIRSGALRGGELPTAEYCAARLGLSPQYMQDMLKFVTGRNLYRYFQEKRMEASRRMLVDESVSPASVAERLGFPNVQCFSTIFKRLNGVSPGEYRTSRN